MTIKSYLNDLLAVLPAIHEENRYIKMYFSTAMNCIMICYKENQYN